MTGAEPATSVRDVPVLVTGACGFVGTNLVHELLRRGARVTALDLPTADWSRLPSDVRRIEGSILDPEIAKRACAGVAIVYHLAARTDLDGRSLDDYAVNVEGTRILVDSARAAVTVRRFVLYSTQLVVGIFNEPRALDESAPYRTATAYGQSKIEAERIVRASCEGTPLEFTIIRPTTVYGPWENGPSRAFFAAVKRGWYVHIGRAANVVSWLHVSNLVDFTILASTSADAADETFFCNDLEPYTMRQVADTAGRYYGRTVRTVPAFLVVLVAYLLGAVKLLGVDVPLYPFRLRNLRATYRYDLTKAQKIGYCPRIGLADGIAQTLDWYERHGGL